MVDQRTDAIRQAFIYKPTAVSLHGDYAILDSTVDPDFLDDYNRPVLAQSFMDNTTGRIFTVAVNHLKSKGSSCDAIGDPDLGDGAGNCNLTRKAAAEAEVEWLATANRQWLRRLSHHRRPELLRQRGSH